VTSGGARQKFTAEQVTTLLAELDRRLRKRGVAAAIFVVGGAAIAATQVRDGRLTADIDALLDDRAVLDEAAAIAADRGLPPDWLNPAARAWMPPLPPGVLSRPKRPGLRVTYADDSFLLATKLVASRAKDADDVVALATRLGMRRAAADELEGHIRRYYTDSEALRFIVGVENVDEEVRYLAEGAAMLLARRTRDA
jgi:hypothetical protein